MQYINRLPCEVVRCVPNLNCHLLLPSLQKRNTIIIKHTQKIRELLRNIKFPQRLSLPWAVLFTTIFWPSSLFHLIEGSGLPLALQRSVTLSPSRTIISLDVNASSIFGGTTENVKILLGYMRFFSSNFLIPVIKINQVCVI